MDARTGEVRLTAEDFRREDIAAQQKRAQRKGRAGNGAVGTCTRIISIDPAYLTPRARRQLGATGRTRVTRNSPCPCGSRKRFKRCCMTP